MNLYVTGMQHECSISIPLVVFEKHVSHVPSRFRLIFIKTGAGIVSIGEQKTPFIAPAVLCLPLDALPCLFLSAQDVVTREIAFHPLFINPEYNHVDPELLWIQAFINRNETYSGLLQLDTLTAHRLDTLVTAVSDALTLQQDNYWPCRSKSYLLESLLIVDRLLSQEHPLKNSQQFIDIPQVQVIEPLISDVLMFIHLNYAQELTLSHLTHRFNVNRTTLNGLFKQHTGKTITQYLIDLRIYVTQILLKNTFLQSAEIMTRVGFNDLTHFNRTFKQRTGLTPTAYREMHCKNA